MQWSLCKEQNCRWTLENRKEENLGVPGHSESNKPLVEGRRVGLRQVERLVPEDVIVHLVGYVQLVRLSSENSRGVFPILKIMNNAMVIKCTWGIFSQRLRLLDFWFIEYTTWWNCLAFPRLTSRSSSVLFSGSRATVLFIS